MLRNGIILIAEVKTKSPFGYISSHSFDELFSLANDYGDIISIHTNERWGGSFELLQKARRLTTKPILAKGIHDNDEEIERAISCGADYVLVVGRIPKDIAKEYLWIEPLSLGGLKAIPREYRVVWNARNLKTGEPKEEQFTEARKIFDGWLCQASYIKTKQDIDQGADAILVGENLSEFIDSI